jgi:mRNA interferase RelE/StbE
LPYKVYYKASIERDLKKIDKAEAKRILNKIEKELRKDPYKGEKLKGEFRGLFRYRVGDYRVICARTSDGILVLRVGHRKDIYR